MGASSRPVGLLPSKLSELSPGWDDAMEQYRSVMRTLICSYNALMETEGALLLWVKHVAHPEGESWLSRRV